MILMPVLHVPQNRSQDPMEEQDPEFNQYFENLFGIPWDEYLLMNEELEAVPLMQTPILITFKIYQTKS